jgi:muramoyltetrapeptide carboxypeptidase LdcA involved in peptidoglycan recycling
VTIRDGTAEGPLFGGCLETICWHVKGSSAWTDPDGAILLLETSEEAPPPPYVDSYLTDLEQLGVFAAASALIVARPYGYGADDTKRLWEVVARNTEEAGLPVLANVEAGHADPKVTLPFGVVAELDAGRKLLRLLEAPTIVQD